VEGKRPRNLLYDDDTQRYTIILETRLLEAYLRLLGIHRCIEGDRKSDVFPWYCCGTRRPIPPASLLLPPAPPTRSRNRWRFPPTSTLEVVLESENRHVWLAPDVFSPFEMHSPAPLGWEEIARDALFIEHVRSQEARSRTSVAIHSGEWQESLF